MKKIEGIYPAMLTPYEANEINEEVFREMIDFGKKAQLTGFFPVSSVGDFACLSLEEKKKLIDVTASEVRGSHPIFPGVSSCDVNESIHLANYAAEKGCDGVIACPPFYYPINDTSLAEHFIRIARSIKIPLIVYNIPLFAPAISKKTFELLAPEKNIIGMKDSSGSIVEFLHFLDILGEREKDFYPFIGREEVFYAGLSLGAKGSMTASASLFPEAMVGIWNFFKKGEHEKAKDVQRSFLCAVRLFMSLPFPYGFRLAMEARGFKMGEGRQVLSKQDKEIVEKQRDPIKKATQEVLLKLKEIGITLVR